VTRSPSLNSDSVNAAFVYCSRVPSSGWVLAFSGGMTTAAPTFVLVFEVEELNALGAAAGGADGFSNRAFNNASRSRAAAGVLISAQT
jgi:hypothetical protein